MSAAWVEEEEGEKGEEGEEEEDDDDMHNIDNFSEHQRADGHSQTPAVAPSISKPSSYHHSHVIIYIPWQLSEHVFTPYAATRLTNGYAQREQAQRSSRKIKHIKYKDEMSEHTPVLIWGRGGLSVCTPLNWHVLRGSFNCTGDLRTVWPRSSELVLIANDLLRLLEWCSQTHMCHHHHIARFLSCMGRAEPSICSFIIRSWFMCIFKGWSKAVISVSHIQSSQRW
jgi:hypothetical protein